MELYARSVYRESWEVKAEIFVRTVPTEAGATESIKHHGNGEPGPPVPAIRFDMCLSGSFPVRTDLFHVGDSEDGA